MCAVCIISPKVLKEKKTLSFIKTYKPLAYLTSLAVQQFLFLAVFFFNTSTQTKQICNQEVKNRYQKYR